MSHIDASCHRVMSHVDGIGMHTIPYPVMHTIPYPMPISHISPYHLWPMLCHASPYHLWPMLCHASPYHLWHGISHAISHSIYRISHTIYRTCYAMAALGVTCGQNYEVSMRVCVHVCIQGVGVGEGANVEAPRHIFMRHVTQS